VDLKLEVYHPNSKIRAVPPKWQCSSLASSGLEPGHRARVGPPCVPLGQIQCRCSPGGPAMINPFLKRPSINDFFPSCTLFHAANHVFLISWWNDVKRLSRRCISMLSIFLLFVSLLSEIPKMATGPSSHRAFHPSGKFLGRVLGRARACPVVRNTVKWQTLPNVSLETICLHPPDPVWQMHTG
jgi:hypothetical protein